LAEQVLRFLLWRLLGVFAGLIGLELGAWLASGGPGRVLRHGAAGGGLHATMGAPVRAILEQARAAWEWTPALGIDPVRLVVSSLAVVALLVALVRCEQRRRRCYVRLEVEPYRTDHASAEAVVRLFEVLHKRLLRRWWRRLLAGQPSVALEVHHGGATPDMLAAGGRDGMTTAAWLAVTCPRGLEPMVESALQAAYPNCRLQPARRRVGSPPTVLRLKKRREFIERVTSLDRFEHEREPAVNRLMTVMGACGAPAFVQVVLTPAPSAFESFARHLYKRREARVARQRREHVVVRDRSLVEETELKGALDVQHRPLFFTDLRVVAGDREVCEMIASELRAQAAENRLVERGTTIRHGLLGLYDRRVRRGEGNPLPCFRKGIFASTELAGLWQLPSIDYALVPFTRNPLPHAPAPPAILRPGDGEGTLCDALGPVSIHVQLRKQNTAVPGTVEQGKTSYLVASVAEDLRRDRCAVIVLDPKGDAAEAALSLVPPSRTCTLLDFSHPTCGFNPLAVDAPADVIADYVVGALKNLFTDADIRASSDRYLRNAIIAVLAHDRSATLWDAARLLSVGEDGYAYRSAVGARVRTLPAFKEISEFFTAELAAQLADARSTTTAKLDAPVNKLARLLNSPSIKRVLLNESLRVDLDRVISDEQVLVVKGALGAMGAGNTSVLMQLLVGMLDAALARQQDLLAADRRVAVALKIDEAPLIINRGFAETMALKRSAGLETVACWQTDAQWVDREIRDQLDALFAHRVYFATASARDARDAVALTMAEFSDTVRPGVDHLSALGHPDVRLHLPRHHAIASWSTPAGRQSPFVARTMPLRADRERLALHAARQHERGGRHLSDLRQPHWDRVRRAAEQPKLIKPGAGRESRVVEQSDGGDADVAASKRRPDATRAAPIAASFGELVDLDRAQRVRWMPGPAECVVCEPDQLDLEILELTARMRHVLSSQIHRRFNPARAATTTQRRLKRLAEAGWIARFQLHRSDGGGVPMCCTITAAGIALLKAHGIADLAEPGSSAGDSGARRGSSTVAHERRLREARGDIHVAGWALALERCTGGACALRGPAESVIEAPVSSTGGVRRPLGPGGLRLSGGRMPHDFSRTDADGARVEVARFETLRPRATICLPAGAGRGVDVLVELDDRVSGAGVVGKLERYDHFLAGWSAHTRRYGDRGEASPMVVFLCRDRSRARDGARNADGILRACRAYAGEYPFDWEYPARGRVLFACERDMHASQSEAYGVPRLPPEVRVSAAGGDPRAGEATAEPARIIGDV
jgi:Replication-relaxation